MEYVATYFVTAFPMRTIILALVALISLASLPASAQPYGGGGRNYDDDGFAPPRYRPGPPRFYDRRRPDYGYGYGRRQRFGRACVTSRGNCVTRPSPINSSYGCIDPRVRTQEGSNWY